MVAWPRTSSGLVGSVHYINACVLFVSSRKEYTFNEDWLKLYQVLHIFDRLWNTPYLRSLCQFGFLIAPSKVRTWLASIMI